MHSGVDACDALTGSKGMINPYGSLYSLAQAVR